MMTVRHIGRYRLGRRLGAGAFGTVWLARDETLEVDVAIKVLADNWVADAGVAERFLAEARLMRRILSPRVVQVHDVGTWDDRPFFVMDYVPGGTLADLDPATLDARAALRLTAGSAYAAQALHDDGVLHRDLKPSNLLLGREGRELQDRVLVADLGLAKSAAEASMFTQAAGTAAFAAPEQLRSDQISVRSDVYSLAAVGYALIAGRPPFPGEGLADVVARDPRRRPDPVAVARGLPAEVDRILGDALSWDPDRRPASAAALGDALLAVLDEGAGAGVLVDSATAARGWPAGLVWLAAAVLCLLSGTIAFVLSG